MKHSVLATSLKVATLASIATLSTVAIAAPDIYGQIRMSFASESAETTKNGITTKDSARPKFTTGNSRIGFKGSEKLKDKLDLEYRLEYRVDVAESTSANFSARQGWIALNHADYGRLQAGRTISKDDDLVTGNAWLWGTGIGPFSGHAGNWVNNSFLYTTPKFNSDTTTAFIHYGMDEGKKGSRSFITFKNGEEKSVDRDFVIVGAQYTKDKTSLNVAYTRAGNDLNSLLGSGEYTINDQWSVHGTAQYTDYNSNDNELALFTGVAYKPKDSVTTWAEISYTDNYKGYGDGEVVGLNVGASYDVSKNLLGFANVGFSKEEYNKTKVDKKGVELGAVYRF
ncbi:porin [Moraxella haemolytica]|uniref:porin n=1 Tax=Moraxella TaxID=475 RepID=UPI002542D52C|nr:porin [Moraxella sp. ZY171148]WII95372.1 porin [Moraxella sp. ZY171148]